MKKLYLLPVLLLLLILIPAASASSNIPWGLTGYTVDTFTNVSCTHLYEPSPGMYITNIGADVWWYTGGELYWVGIDTYHPYAEFEWEDTITFPEHTQINLSSSTPKLVDRIWVDSFTADDFTGSLNITWKQNLTLESESYVNSLACMNISVTPERTVNGTIEATYSIVEFTDNSSVGDLIVMLDDVDVSTDASILNETVTLEVSGLNTSSHWINISTVYDTVDPVASAVSITPDYDLIANGTVVEINISWTDTYLDSGAFYVDYGSGYVEEDNISFSGTSDWFNTTINTTGYTGETISWYQLVYDDVGNSGNYSDSFNVSLDAFIISVFDEGTALSILPSSVSVYNETVSYDADINGTTNISTLSYSGSGLDSGKYVVSVTADDYYTRRSIVYVDTYTLSELNVYLPSENETVIFDQFVLSDHTLLYNYSDCIFRLDKSFQNGTDTIFSSYFDFNGVTSTYLIATDQYILYIETPDSTINYGWLTPDADGQIDIVITSPITDLLDDWLSYSLTGDSGTITLNYDSEIPIDTCYFYVNAENGSNIYNASSSTDTGSFNYVGDANSVYWVNFTAVSDSGSTKELTRLITFNDGGVQPERMDLLPEGAPDWFYNMLSVGIIIIAVLIFSQIRSDIACVIGAAFTGIFWYWGALKVTGMVVAVAALIAISAVIYKSRREGI